MIGLILTFPIFACLIMFLFKKRFLNNFMINLYALLHLAVSILSIWGIESKGTYFAIDETNKIFLLILSVVFFFVALYNNGYSHIKYSALDIMNSYDAIIAGKTPTLDPKIFKDKIVIIGFSAGANLSARASTLYAENSYKKIDVIDDVSPKPNFTGLMYPAYCDEPTYQRYWGNKAKVESIAESTTLVMVWNSTIRVARRSLPTTTTPIALSTA